MDEFLSYYKPLNVVLEIDAQEVAINASTDSPYHVSDYITNLSIPAGSSYDAMLQSFGKDPLPPVLPYLLITEVCGFIKPLSVGDHTINVRAFDAGWGYSFSEVSSIDWHITVTQ